MNTCRDLYAENVTVTYSLIRTLLERAYANLDYDEDWPTSEDLGGHQLLGTRDDELKFAAREYAEEVIEALRPDIEKGLQ